jgi:O-antigen/teichoic acid export membrane protein
LKSSEFKRKALGAAVWTVVGSVADQGIRFALFIFLARALTPRDFGIFAVATLFMDYAKLIASAGLSESVVQSEESPPDLLDTIFWSSVGMTALIAVLLASLSGVLTSAAGAPEAQPILLALAGIMLIGPLGSVHGGLAIRQFKNKRRTLNGVVSSIIAAASALVVLSFGGGLWSLVVQQLVSNLVGVVLAWTTVSWMPRFRFSPHRLRSLWHFSGNLLLARFLQMSVGRVQELLAVRFLGPAMLGQFRVGGRVFELINSAFISPLAAMTLPILSRLQSQDQTFHNAYGRMIALSCLGVCPAAFGIGAVAQDLTPLVFGEQWLPAVPVIQIMALLSPASAMSHFSGPALAAKGRPDVTVKFAAMQLVGTAIFSGVAVSFGISALAWALVLRAYLMFPVQLRLFSTATGMPIRAILSNIIPPVIASVVMGATVLATRYALLDWAPIARIAVMIPVGIVCYFGVLLLAFRPFLVNQVTSLSAVILRK